MITPVVCFWFQVGAFVMLSLLAEVFGRGIGTKYYDFVEEKEWALDFSLGFAIASCMFSIAAIWAGVTERIGFFGVAISVIVAVVSFVFCVLKIYEKQRGYSFF